jgi:hypothetical protein
MKSLNRDFLTLPDFLKLDDHARSIAEDMKHNGVVISDALKKQLIKSVCSECPVCGETVFNQILLGPDLEEHIRIKNDDAHLVLSVMNS